MIKKRKIVIVGLGSIGRRHARLLTERQDVNIAYCDRLKQTFTAHLSSSSYKTCFSIAFLPDRIKRMSGISFLFSQVLPARHPLRLPRRDPERGSADEAPQGRDRRASDPLIREICITSWFKNS